MIHFDHSRCRVGTRSNPAAGIKYRSAVRGPIDMQVDTRHGGSIVYWNGPDGHQWELLTVSYARQPT